VAGQVKTRVAATVGHQRAVEVYVELLKHTQKVIGGFLEQHTTEAQLKVKVYYGDYVNPNDLWDELPVQKHLQAGADLGARMKNAFADAFGARADKVLIIGSDCLALNPTHLQAAFEALAQHEVAIGPALDGGYYLLGMTRLHDFVFENKPWSEPTLLTQTQADLKANKVNYQLLETLSDIDTWEDYARATAI